MRNRIYRLLFVLDKPIVLGWPFRSTPALIAGITSNRVPIPQLTEAMSALLVTSKDCYLEGASILYGENTFYAPTFKSVQLFSQLIGTYATACIQVLVIDFDGIDNGIDDWNNYARSHQLLLQFKSLGSVVIENHMSFQSAAVISPALAVGTLVPPKVKRHSRYLPGPLPNLPKLLVDYCLQPHNFDVFFDVLLTLHNFECFSIQQLDLLLRLVPISRERHLQSGIDLDEVMVASILSLSIPN